MKHVKTLIAVGCIGIAALSLAACSGGSQQPATPETPSASSSSVAPAASSSSGTPAAAPAEYADYIGTYTGTDPWGGTLTLTITSIENGSLFATYSDDIEDTIYVCNLETMIDDDSAPFALAAFTNADDTAGFNYAGYMEFTGNGQIKFVYETGSVFDDSEQGGYSAYHAEALDEAAKTVTLTKAD